MHWTNAPTAAARRLPRSDAAGRSAEGGGGELQMAGRGDAARPADPDTGADQGVARGRPTADGNDAASSPQPDVLDERDPAPGPGLLRLRHVDRA